MGAGGGARGIEAVVARGAARGAARRAPGDCNNTRYVVRAWQQRGGVDHGQVNKAEVEVVVTRINAS